jgi:hypothetical protein
LKAVKAGVEQERLAVIIGVSLRTIQRWIKRAKENPQPKGYVRIELLEAGYPKTCKHGVPLVDGMPIYCLNCDETGVPGHPAFRKGTKKKDPPKKKGKKLAPATGGAGRVVYQTRGPSKAKPSRNGKLKRKTKGVTK